MMTQTASIQNAVTSLSQEVLDYLQSADTFGKYERIAHGYTSDASKREMLSVILFRAVKGIDPIADLPKNLQSFYQISEQQTQSMLQAIGEDILEPIAAEVPGLEGALRTWGVRLHDTTTMPEKPSIDQFIRAFVQSMPEEPEARIQHRIEKMLNDYVKGAVSKQDTIEHLTRDQKTGGAEFDPKDIPAILEMIERERDRLAGLETKRVQDVSTAPTPVVLSPIVTIANAAPPATIRPPKIVAFTKEDEAEVARVQENKQHVIASPKPIVSVQDVIDRVCKDSSFHFEDPQMQQRCEKIVESRVRDVRDAHHTQAQFEKSAQTGGLGMVGRRLADMVQTLERAVEEYQATMLKDVSARRVTKPIAETKPDEQTRMDDRYTHLTQQVKQAISTTKKQEQPKPAPRPPLIRPNMQDVQFAKRLMGPIEELQGMSLKEFRRLSEIPARAVEKVLSKVDLLEQQGYDQKVQGITAWRGSPIYQQYVSVTQEAVEQTMPVTQIIAKRKAGGEDVLTPEEYQALAHINASLRF